MPDAKETLKKIENEFKNFAKAVIFFKSAHTATVPQPLPNIFTKINDAKKDFRAMVVAQLVKRSLPTPEVRSSNPVIGKLLHWTFICLLY